MVLIPSRIGLLAMDVDDFIHDDDDDCGYDDDNDDGHNYDGGDILFWHDYD